MRFSELLKGKEFWSDKFSDRLVRFIKIGDLPTDKNTYLPGSGTKITHRGNAERGDGLLFFFSPEEEVAPLV